MKDLFARGMLVMSVSVALCAPHAEARQGATPAATFIPYADAAPVFLALREDLLPADFRGRTAAERAALWPEWASRRDRAIRARVEEGDSDSIVYFLQFGTTFTRQPRLGERELAGVVVREAGGRSSRFVPSPVLLARIDDFLGAVSAPDSADQRVRFARQVIARRGIDPSTGAGRATVRQYLLDRVEVIGQAERRSRLIDPDGDAVDQATIFRDRGLASDTSMQINFGVERALAELHGAGLLRRDSVRRVAVLGPGLDFVDKQEGYDFYPEQTIQPFALIETLGRLGLSGRDLHVTAFDVSSRVLQHLEHARSAARDGRAYTVVLPRSLEQPWTPELVRYWARFGEGVGTVVPAPAPPSTAGRVDVRSVAIQPPVVAGVVPRDLNIVLQRPGPHEAGGPFDLVVATNLLVYYDVFEQSLALANVAAMLRPGGVFLSNDRLFDLPQSPLAAVGQTTAVYVKGPAGAAGDRIDWYQRRR